MTNEMVFSIKAACNIISNSGYTFEETCEEITKLKENGKISAAGYIKSDDLPKIKRIIIKPVRKPRISNRTTSPLQFMKYLEA